MKKDFNVSLVGKLLTSLFILSSVSCGATHEKIVRPSTSRIFTFPRNQWRLSQLSDRICLDSRVVRVTSSLSITPSLIWFIGPLKRRPSVPGQPSPI